MLEARDLSNSFDFNSGINIKDLKLRSAQQIKKKGLNG